MQTGIGFTDSSITIEFLNIFGYPSKVCAQAMVTANVIEFSIRLKTDNIPTACEIRGRDSIIIPLMMAQNRVRFFTVSS